jgi:hypothetical protein
MALSAHETALLNFGRDVLYILEFDTDWSHDTLQVIANSAESFGLAATDDDGMLQIIPADQF